MSNPKKGMTHSVRMRPFDDSSLWLFLLLVSGNRNQIGSFDVRSVDELDGSRLVDADDDAEIADDLAGIHVDHQLVRAETPNQQLLVGQSEIRFGSRLQIHGDLGRGGHR